MSQLRHHLINMDEIDKICKQINEHERFIAYGSPTLLNLLFDFQVDMKIFDKTVLLSSVNNGKILVPKNNDLIDLLPDYYSTTSLPDGAEDLDWMHINSLSLVDKSINVSCTNVLCVIIAIITSRNINIIPPLILKKNIIFLTSLVFSVHKIFTISISDRKSVV